MSQQEKICVKTPEEEFIYYLRKDLWLLEGIAFGIKDDKPETAARILGLIQGIRKNLKNLSREEE